MNKVSVSAPITEAQIDRAFAALADSTRRAILRQLGAGETSVGGIAASFAISQPAISRHLRVLERAGLIESGRDGQLRPRRLRPQGLAPAEHFLQGMATFWPDRFDALTSFLDETKDLK